MSEEKKQDANVNEANELSDENLEDVAGGRFYPTPLPPEVDDKISFEPLPPEVITHEYKK